METSEVTDEGTDAPSGDDAPSDGRKDRSGQGRKARDAAEARKVTDAERATEIAERARANGTARPASEVVTRKVDPAELRRQAEHARERGVGQVRPPEPTPETPEPRRPRQPSPPAAAKGTGAKPSQAPGEGPQPAPAAEPGGVKTKPCKRCGEPFEVEARNQQYHPECQALQKAERKARKSKRARERKREPAQGPAPGTELESLPPPPIEAQDDDRQRYIDMLFRIAESDEADWLRTKDALDRLERLTS